MKTEAGMDAVLRYPGSKWNLADRLVRLIPEHHSYVEPYFGSGAVFFRKAPSAIETINDLDSDVVNLFRCIQKDSDRLARLVMTTPYAREAYERQFGRTPQSLYASDFQRAAGFLVKCWQGHGFRTDGSKVGWKRDVQGRERAYALWDWYRLPERILGTAERLRRAQIEHRPALEVIRDFNYPNVFLYLDPPYLLGTRSGGRTQYRHEMTDEDHAGLLETVSGSRAMVMLSGYESELYGNYLKGWRKVNLRGSAQGGKPRDEVVWMNYDPPGYQMTLGDMDPGTAGGSAQGWIREGGKGCLSIRQCLKS